jgi:hypothetical protein
MVLDRIEGDRAVLLFGEERVELPASALPAGAREGDMLTFVLAPDAKAAALAEAEARLARLRARSVQGPDSFDL